MVYDFVSKIKNVQNAEIAKADALDALISEINTKFDAPLDVKFVLPDLDKTGEVLVKSQASISSMPSLHDKELDAAIAAFVAYLEEIAVAIEGEISRNDGFYNNSKTFKKLFT